MINETRAFGEHGVTDATLFENALVIPICLQFYEVFQLVSIILPLHEQWSRKPGLN